VETVYFKRVFNYYVFWKKLSRTALWGREVISSQVVKEKAGNNPGLFVWQLLCMGYGFRPASLRENVR